MTNLENKFQKYDFPDFGYIELPDIDIPENIKKELGLNSGATNSEVLRNLCYKGFEKKLLSKQIPQNESDKYTKQCQYEIEKVLNIPIKKVKC